jgi:hypothetical protein
VTTYDLHCALSVLLTPLLPWREAREQFFLGNNPSPVRHLAVGRQAVSDYLGIFLIYVI